MKKHAGVFDPIVSDDLVLLCAVLLRHRWKNYRVDRCRPTDFPISFSVPAKMKHLWPFMAWTFLLFLYPVSLLYNFIENIPN